jgi:predicted Zn-dependent protease
VQDYYSLSIIEGFGNDGEVFIMMRKSTYRIIGVGLFMVLLSACSTVPVTGRQQLDLVPSDQIMAMSADQYQKFMSEHEVVTGTEESRMVKRVGGRISSAVEKYLAQQNKSDILQGYNWEFNLVKDDSANAWAMPGGKVVVYTGILPITQDETGLATVMGHEVAHAVAHHGNERMSQALLAQLGGTALSVALSQNPSQTNELFMAAYGMGAQVGVLLPYNRLQESEADHLGLVFMAIAGYDPRKALDFWQRMAAQEKGGAPPEYLSTHPAHETRIEQIKENLPEAMKYFRK